MDKEFKFIHIPKTGGTSIKNSGLINSNNWENHKRSRDISNLNNFFTFVLIRNPYQKVLSSYQFICRLEIEQDRKHNLRKFKNFKECILHYNELFEYDCLIPHFKITSYEYITDDFGNELVDYWGYFNNISNEYVKVQSLNGIKNPIELKFHSNRSEYKHWKTYYDTQTAEIVYNNWKIDFDYFNFDKYSYK